MTELSVPVEAHLLQDDDADSVWAPLPSELRFSTDDPLAAVLRLGPAAEDFIDWTFAFDLVYRASVGWSTAGSGDVRFDIDALSPEHILLTLRSANGSCLIRLTAVDIKKYVHAVKSALTATSEVDVVSEALDRAIYAILKG